jgi:hypothetical protein
MNIIWNLLFLGCFNMFVPRISSFKPLKTNANKILSSSTIKNFADNSYWAEQPAIPEAEPSMNTGAQGKSKFFSGYTVYKAKSAVAIKPVSPTFKSIGNSLAVDREGCLFFEFAPGGTRPREYDWNQKGSFALSVTECGGLLSHDAKSSTELTFTHDPKAGTAESGQTVKRFKISAAPDGKGVYVNLQIVNKQGPPPINLSVMVTHGELEVIKSMTRYCLPYFLGLDRVFE